MGGPASTDSTALLDLVDGQRWQRLQDHFSNVLGIPLRTVRPSRELVVTPSWPPGLSADRIVKFLRVGDELDRLLPTAEPPRDPTTLTTTMGVTYAAVPIHVTPDQVLAYVIVGPMVVGQREDEGQFRQRMEERGIDWQAIWPLLLLLKLYTFAGIRSVLDLLQEVGSSLAQFAYQAKQLEVILPTVSRVGQAVAAYHSERVLHSLLDAAVLATRADGGSVMVYDPRVGALRIQAAQGLSNEVVTLSRLKRGEGLAGLACAERTVLLLDAHAADARLRERMRRDELVSSLVAPVILEPDREPIGVLNLRTANPQQRFGPEQVELVRRLLDLASVALKSLQLAAQPTPAPS